MKIGIACTTFRHGTAYWYYGLECDGYYFECIVF